MTATPAPALRRPMQDAYGKSWVYRKLSAMAEQHRRDERHLHARWRLHESRCPLCLRGLPCSVADRYATAADDAGKRFRLAEERERKASREVAPRLLGGRS